MVSQVVEREELKIKSATGSRFAIESPIRASGGSKGLFMQGAKDEKRIERGWALLGGWFESLEGNPDVPIHLRFGVVELDAARSCLQAIERKDGVKCGRTP